MRCCSVDHRSSSELAWSSVNPEGLALSVLSFPQSCQKFFTDIYDFSGVVCRNYPCFSLPCIPAEVDLSCELLQYSPDRNLHPPDPLHYSHTEQMLSTANHVRKDLRQSGKMQTKPAFLLTFHHSGNVVEIQNTKRSILKRNVMFHTRKMLRIEK